MELNVSYSGRIDEEYKKLFRRLNPPRVVIDSDSCKDATIIRIDSANKHGILLHVVQTLTDLNLSITKAYISSDGGWFMDVFNVTDHEGKKVYDVNTFDFIRNSICPESWGANSARSVELTPLLDYTIIELIGSDRPGLISELTAILVDLNCNVLNGELWTHNARAAAVIQVTDDKTGSAITDPERLSKIKELLRNVLKGSNGLQEAKISLSREVLHAERRLHQLMLADTDYEPVKDDGLNENEKPHVEIDKWNEKDYSVITITSKDRPKLLFDILCTLTDLDYVVFHANIDAEGPQAHHDYYIRNLDGSSIISDEERLRVIKCLESAIMRRVSQGLKLQVCTSDRVGLLSDVTRIFRENSLCVTRAEVKTKDGKAVNTFYVQNVSGYPVDSKTIDSIRQKIGSTILKVENAAEEEKPRESGSRSLFGNLFRSKSFVNFGLIRSYS